MNRDAFVQNIKFYCERKGLKPTSACKDAGVGTSFVTDIKRGQTPSVEKVEQLAHYLGTTVSVLIGETSPQPQTAVLHDSAVVVQPSDVKRLTVSEVEMVMAYRRARQEIKNIVDGALAPYAKKENTASIG